MDVYSASSTLTVGRSDSFANNGAMIGLVTHGDWVQIEVNLPAVEAAHLKLSPRLLSLATVDSPKPEARN